MTSHYELRRLQAMIPIGRRAHIAALLLIRKAEHRHEGRFLREKVKAS